MSRFAYSAAALAASTSATVARAVTSLQLMTAMYAMQRMVVHCADKSDALDVQRRLPKQLNA